MKKDSKGGAGIKEGLSSHEKFNAKDGGAKADKAGRVTKRPMMSGGRTGKIKGRE
jgi:hypothetical protein